ncbi:MAG: hypothetical protein LIP02_12420 [Bacteroidales bacterium]|nr:hypothetical protein [Bacteroidales bacterium]
MKQISKTLIHAILAAAAIALIAPASVALAQDNSGTVSAPVKQDERPHWRLAADAEAAAAADNSKDAEKAAKEALKAQQKAQKEAEKAEKARVKAEQKAEKERIKAEQKAQKEAAKAEKKKLARYRDLQKLLDRYDVAAIIANVPKGDAGDFWNVIWNHNNQMLTMRNAIANNSSAMRAGQNRVESLMASIYRYFDTFGYQSIDTVQADQLIANLGLDIDNSPFTLDIVPSSRANAFVTPEGNMFISKGMVTACGSSQSALVGIAAATFTHFLLWDTTWDAYCLERAAQTRGIFAIALGVTNLASTFIPGNVGNIIDFTSGSGLIVVTAASIAAMGDDIAAVQFEYKPEQLMRADLVAYRYLQWIGADPVAYINLLSNLARAPLYVDQIQVMAQRVELLRYVHDTDARGAGTDFQVNPPIPGPFLTPIQAWQQR